MRTSPRLLPSTTSVAIGDPGCRRIVRMDHDFRTPSRRDDVGVSLNVELRKFRAGEVASRNGWTASTSSITSQ